MWSNVTYFFRGRGNFWKLSDDADLRDGRGRGKNRNYIDASRFRDYDEYRYRQSYLIPMTVKSHKLLVQRISDIMTTSGQFTRCK